MLTDVFSPYYRISLLTNTLCEDVLIGSLKGIVHPKMKILSLIAVSNATMFKAQKGSKDIVKIVHVTSVVQPYCYEAMRILFCAQWKQK